MVMGRRSVGEGEAEGDVWMEDVPLSSSSDDDQP